MNDNSNTTEDLPIDLEVEDRINGDPDMGAFENTCLFADVNDDGEVDAYDLGFLLEAWGCTTCTDEDLDGSGTVDADDVDVWLLGVVCGEGGAYDECNAMQEIGLDGTCDDCSDWADFYSNIANSNYRCWMIHHIFCTGPICAHTVESCFGGDPYDPCS